MTKVEELSNGRIKWRYFPNQQLGPGAQQLEIIGTGSADVGFIIPAFFTGKVAVFGVQDFPFLITASDFSEHQRIVINLFHQPEFVDALAKLNIKLLWADVQGKMSLWTRFPIEKLKDIEGKKIRTAGKWSSEGTAALGASPQSMIASEVYLALQTGVVDGAYMSNLGGLGFKWQEVAKYFTIPAISQTGYGSCTGMNIDSFNKLPKDLQEVMLRAAKESEEYAQRTFFKFDKETTEKLTGMGVKVVHLPMDETLRWREKVRPLYDKWIVEMGAPAKRAYDYLINELARSKS